MVKAIKSKPLSNVEFVLLQLISEKDELSGYEISKFIEESGYREWTNIGETSIYAGLDKLNKKELVEFYVHADKQGKGPLPKKFRLTNRGKKNLKTEILAALSSTRERDRRFDLAIASMPFLMPREAIIALNERKKFLKSELERIKTKLEVQGGENLPFHIKALFKHPLVLIKTELEFVDGIINSLEERLPDK